MILGTLIYCLFASLATVGMYLAVRRQRDATWALGSAACALLFFVGLYIALDVWVLAELRSW